MTVIAEYNKVVQSYWFGIKREMWYTCNSSPIVNSWGDHFSFDKYKIIKTAIFYKSCVLVICKYSYFGLRELVPSD